MEHITLPGSDLSVSPVCIGCWQFNAGVSNITWAAQTEEVSKSIVDKALQVGINFFDTAEAYPQSEKVLGKCLQGRRHNAVIATKFGNRGGDPNIPPYSVEDIEISITQSLQSLQTSCIDIYQIHWPSVVKDTTAAIEELKRQIARGRIRYFGLSNYGPKMLGAVLEAGGHPLTNQICYNLLWRSPEHELIPVCQENNISIMAYSPLQQGLLSGKYMKLTDVPEGRRRSKLYSMDSTKLARHGTEGAEQEVSEALVKIREICDNSNYSMSSAALSWIIHHQTVPVAIVGARSPEQVEENANVLKLSQEIMNQFSIATEDVKKKIGKTLDPWASQDRTE